MINRPVEQIKTLIMLGSVLRTTPKKVEPEPQTSDLIIGFMCLVALIYLVVDTIKIANS